MVGNIILILLKI